MGFLYFDESKHERRGFVLCAWIFCDRDPTTQLSAAMVRLRFAPGIDEFKSSAPMLADPRRRELRNEFGIVLDNSCRISVCVSPNLDALRIDSLRLLSNVQQHALLFGKNHQAYLDQGLYLTLSHGQQCLKVAGDNASCEVHFEQDSKLVLGIQLADLAAHYCATMLAEELGFVTKTVKAGPESGYEETLDMNIGFEIWGGHTMEFSR